MDTTRWLNFRLSHVLTFSDKVVKILRAYSCLRKQNVVNMASQRHENQNLKIFLRKNYAKWVNHVIETCDMWCAMFELCLYSIPGTHLTHTVDPPLSHTFLAEKEIESGGNMEKVFNFMV